MSNKEIAALLVDELGIIYTDCNRITIKNLLIKMAEWKDEQFEKQEQQLIDKACGWLKNNIDDYYTTNEFEQWFDEMFEDFKQAMKGE